MPASCCFYCQRDTECPRVRFVFFVSRILGGWHTTMVPIQGLDGMGTSQALLHSLRAVLDQGWWVPETLGLSHRLRSRVPRAGSKNSTPCQDRGHAAAVVVCQSRGHSAPSSHASPSARSALLSFSVFFLFKNETRCRHVPLPRGAIPAHRFSVDRPSKAHTWVGGRAGTIREREQQRILQVQPHFGCLTSFGKPRPSKKNEKPVLPMAIRLLRLSIRFFSPVRWFEASRGLPPGGGGK